MIIDSAAAALRVGMSPQVATLNSLSALADPKTRRPRYCPKAPPDRRADTRVIADWQRRHSDPTCPHSGRPSRLAAPRRENSLSPTALGGRTRTPHSGGKEEI